MTMAVMNHVLETGHEVVARWDGRWIVKRDGKLTITQRTLRAYVRAKARIERVHALLQSAFEKGAAVEAGILDAGLYAEDRKTPNWREAFVRLGGDPEVELKRTKAKTSISMRVHRDGEKPRGEKIAPK